MVAIDSPADYPERAVEMLRGFSERPGKRFKSLEEAIANFRMLPRETLATREVLAACGASHLSPDAGRRLDSQDRSPHHDSRADQSRLRPGEDHLPRALRQSPQESVSDTGASATNGRDDAAGKLAVLPDSYHHAMFDNPAGLVAILKEFLRVMG